MKNKETRIREGAGKTQILQDSDLAQAAGGAGYSSIQCRQCGKVFPDMEQYGKHVEQAHTNVRRRP